VRGLKWGQAGCWLRSRKGVGCWLYGEQGCWGRGAGSGGARWVRKGAGSGGPWRWGRVLAPGEQEGGQGAGSMEAGTRMRAHAGCALTRGSATCLHGEDAHVCVFVQVCRCADVGVYGLHGFAMLASSCACVYESNHVFVFVRVSVYECVFACVHVSMRVCACVCACQSMSATIQRAYTLRADAHHSIVSLLSLQASKTIPAASGSSKPDWPLSSTGCALLACPARRAVQSQH